tara:strand:- start:162 stop:833 length:672 start_codon:yes stop_codon:yes gene_type:complete
MALAFFLQFCSFTLAQNISKDKSLAISKNIKEVKTSNQILIDFLTNTKSLKADFSHEQSNSNGKAITFTGKLVFRRPDRLRWEVKTPYPQLQLLRGKEFLLYDKDLQQVTVREIDDSLFESPAGLLFSSGPGAKKLLNNRYTLISAPEKNNLKWVLARPKNLTNDNPTIELGLNSDGLLSELITLDIFGRSSRIILTNISWNEVIKDVAFVPIIPSGVEFLKQ